MFDYEKSKGCCLTDVSHLSVSNEENWDDTISELLVFVLNKVVENWRAYGDTYCDRTGARVAQTEFSDPFDNEGKSVIFPLRRLFLKEDRASSSMCLNITSNLKGFHTGLNKSEFLKGCRK